MEQEPINPPMRKGIKVAAQVAQIARLITLMPTPQDFLMDIPIFLGITSITNYILFQTQLKMS